MSSIVYGVTEETYQLYGRCRISYGIAAYDNGDEEETAAIIASVRDISSRRELVEELVRLCNCLDLSPLHLNDAVEDYLAIL